MPLLGMQLKLLLLFLLFAQECCELFRFLSWIWIFFIKNFWPKFGIFYMILKILTCISKFRLTWIFYLVLGFFSIFYFCHNNLSMFWIVWLYAIFFNTGFFDRLSFVQSFVGSRLFFFGWWHQIQGTTTQYSRS